MPVIWTWLSDEIPLPHSSIRLLFATAVCFASLSLNRWISTRLFICMMQIVSHIALVQLFSWPVHANSSVFSDFLNGGRDADGCTASKFQQAVPDWDHGRLPLVILVVRDYITYAALLRITLSISNIVVQVCPPKGAPFLGRIWAPKW